VGLLSNFAPLALAFMATELWSSSSSIKRLDSRCSRIPGHKSTREQRVRCTHLCGIAVWYEALGRYHVVERTYFESMLNLFSSRRTRRTRLF
jgi:hypothetical protein